MTIDITVKREVGSLAEDELRRLSKAELVQYAETITAQLEAVVELARHWNSANERLIARRYVSPFRYTPEEMAQAIRQAIFWADWPNTEHRDILADGGSS